MDRSDRLTTATGFAALLLLTVATACSGTSEPTPESATRAPADPAAASKPVLHDPLVIGRLRAAALDRAARAGVTSPATVRAVAAADHQAAEDVVSGAVVGDHAPVFVVQLTGGPFTAERHPAHAAAPRGSALTVTFDARTFRVTDVGFDDVAPDLSRIDADVVDLLAP